MLHIPGLYIAPSAGRGRGVFTATDIAAGSLIELCPVIVIPPDQRSQVDQTVFYDYYFNWPEPTGAACLPLGYGGLYNHHPDPNAEIVLDLDAPGIQIHARRDIIAGSELFLDYSGGEGAERAGLWFAVV